jgi:cell division septum initiation protein DivIVA
MAAGATNSRVFAERSNRMSDFDRPGLALADPVSRRSRFGHLSDRLARTFGVQERPPADEHEWEYADEEEYGVTPPPWERVESRFPTARQGYDRAAVDERIDALEREIAELRSNAAAASAVTAEIERIGEQTSAILTVAHDQAQEMTREAREQADRCLADAASNAVMITEGAKRKLHQLDSDTDAVWQERVRLIEDVRGVASSLLSLAQDADARFPSQPEKPSVEPAIPEPVPAPEPSPADSAGDDTVALQPPEFHGP